MNDYPTNTGEAGHSQEKTGVHIIVCAKREDPFARIPKTVLDDPHISWRAKGVLSYLLGKPAGWKTRISDIRKHGKEGERAIRAALMELRVAGYAQLVQLRDGKKIKEWVWKISDSQIFQKLDGRNVHVENVDVQNHHHSKKEMSKKDSSEIKTKESEETEQSSEPSFSAVWKPDKRTKAQQLKAIETPHDFPCQREFQTFLINEGLEDIIENYRPDLYSSLCNQKWHQWIPEQNKWRRIFNWEKYVTGLAEKIEDSRKSGGGF